ncbi:MAG: CvpA family protein [Candidatus Electrothrix sp. YB6]
MSFNDISLFDYLLVAVLLLFTGHGVWAGFMRQLATFFAFIGSYWFAGQYTGKLLPHVQQVTGNPKVVFLGFFTILLLASVLIFHLIRLLLRKIIQVKLLNWVDRFFLGLLLGLGKGGLTAVLFYMVAASSLAPADQFFRNALSAPYLAQGAALARRCILHPKVRAAFLPKQVDDKKKKEEQHTAPPPADRTDRAAGQGDQEDDPAASTEILTR